MPRKMSDPGTMPEKKMKSEGDAGEDEEFKHDSEKNNEIRASSGEGFGQAPKKVGSEQVSKKVESRQIPKKRNLGESRKGGNLGEYQRKVESGRVLEKGIGEYRERVESERVPEK